MGNLKFRLPPTKRQQFKHVRDRFAESELTPKSQKVPCKIPNMRASSEKINNICNFNGFCCFIVIFITWSASCFRAPPASITHCGVGLDVCICKHHSLILHCDLFEGDSDHRTATQVGLTASKEYLRCVALALFKEIRERGLYFWGCWINLGIRERV